ncbi:alkaline phosphatase [Limnochorda pilosa]|uniref:TVP38/TMEM64 family membrane protein n=2 Tax=Limnochorda pilosa TaxID=1555112 RepID=A0A0K2SHN5_LIMPI|nr:alkaline phosphatase [Limnochorda pilosa]
MRGLGSAEAIQAWVEQFGVAGPLVMAVLQVVQVVVAPIPGAATAVASGFLFGPWIGSLVSEVGIVAGSALAFFLARRFGRPLVVRMVSRGTLERVDRFVRRRGATALFLFFLIPFLPDDVACLAAGLSPIPFRLFMVLVLVGRTPAIVVGSLTGARLVELSPAAWVLLAAGALALAVLLARYEERLSERFWRLLNGIRPR